MNNIQHAKAAGFEKVNVYMSPAVGISATSAASQVNELGKYIAIHTHKILEI